MARPRITKKIARRLGSIASMLDAAAQEAPGVCEDGSLVGRTDLYVECETEQDVEEVHQAVEYLKELIGHLEQKHG